MALAGTHFSAMQSLDVDYVINQKDVSVAKASCSNH